MTIMVIIVEWGLGPDGLGWVSYLVGWVWVDEMDPRTTLADSDFTFHSAQN